MQHKITIKIIIKKSHNLVFLMVLITRKTKLITRFRLDLLPGLPVHRYVLPMDRFSCFYFYCGWNGDGLKFLTSFRATT